MLSWGMCDKLIKISQRSLGESLTHLLPQGGGEGTAEHGKLPEFLYQRHLEDDDQVTAHMWLIDSTFQ